MFKYNFIYPILYKLFDTNSLTRKSYRYLGNKIGERTKTNLGLTKNYLSQGRKINFLFHKYCKVEENDNLLELGTGWLHWYATFFRIFNNVKIDLFDVWDNRKINTFKKVMKQLTFELTTEENEKLVNKNILNILSEVNSFDEVYNILDYNYIINPNGSLRGLKNDYYKIIFSCAVFEHIDRKILKEYFKQMNRILIPGGYLVHIIDMGDHYHYKDKNKTHFKNYLNISNVFWKNYYENSIFYINRVQVSEWKKYFFDSGFDLVCEEKFYVNIDNLEIHKDFINYDKDDLSCHQYVSVFKKYKNLK